MSMPESQLRTWAIAGIALAVGVAIRVHNAFAYKMLWGFDALSNWRYIEYLTQTWVLPAPDAAWSTAHPPLYYYLCAAICRGLDDPDRAFNVIILRLLASAVGLLTVALVVVLVRRTDPDNLRRALLAGGLVLFLPVHIYMSAMLTEEILVTSLISLVIVGVALEQTGLSKPVWLAAGLGLIAGLAFLTKLTGVLVMVAAAGTYLIEGWRSRAMRPAILRASVLVLLTVLIGGWFFARNLVEYGYLYPHGLEVHKIMFSMPPGDRQIWDYLRIPLATWTDPQLLHPSLLRSVWGSTFVTMWFDGHRVFLPTNTPVVTHVGTAILLLALLPTAAFAVGFTRGVKRMLRGGRRPDTILILITAITLSAYVLFTWRNPWFAVHKASFMLSLSLPFAYYASAVLDDWTHKNPLIRFAVWSVLAILAVLISGTFSFSELFWNMDHMSKPGVAW